MTAVVRREDNRSFCPLFLRLIPQHFRATLFHNSCIYFDYCHALEYAA